MSASVKIFLVKNERIYLTYRPFMNAAFFAKFSDLEENSFLVISFLKAALGNASARAQIIIHATQSTMPVPTGRTSKV